MLPSAIPCASGASTASASRRSATSSRTGHTGRSWTLERCGILDACDHAEHRHAPPQGGHARARRGSRQHRHLLVPGLRWRRLARAGARAAAGRRDGVPRCAACGEPAEARRRAVRRARCPSAALERARELCERAEVLLCIGSSLEVHPVAGLPLLPIRGWRRARDPHAGPDAARQHRRRAPARRCRG